MILAIDTSAAHCAAALLSDDGTLTTRVETMAKGQAERLMPMIATLIAESGHEMADLRGIAVGTGPGNFTGIRIGVAAARGLALGLGVPAIGVSQFDVLAQGATLPATITLPGSRGQAYRQHFDADGTAAAPEVFDPEKPPAEPPAPADLVAAIARIGAARAGQPQPRPAPVYVRAADAAPPRDPAPQILP
ncbi:tRNA threonylcarbamoyladenosine biosynthesis protein TsaB [Ketogulonicigenium robustum]|uniref:tRNA threonylcarbamoyladenosine biosynthesis protein TsaB n=1 Tax=Ketogulonicigenium robustum TaxID=92947 RepID=A0A1W6NXQ0_9RHOB|nr:tRNA (adenosine(37)-N6)-threonylcarbamoyltransferase complex dimerization subunit type 1 TsaB [Ketogulonicigenium robustum]ARO14004.1 tRNA threonylcarbamoyladenosine biosynthesis protein TsaB [Ketogulonicigenium robustum]